MTEPMGAGPRADFACLSKKCRTEQGAAVYELPTTATRCPVCGSKKITRVWSGKAPGVLSGSRKHRKTISEAVARTTDRARAQKDSRLRLEKEMTSDSRIRQWAQGIGVAGGVGMMDVRQASQKLGVSIGGSRPTGQAPTVYGAPVRGRGPTPVVRGAWNPKGGKA